MKKTLYNYGIHTGLINNSHVRIKIEVLQKSLNKKNII